VDVSPFTTIVGIPTSSWTLTASQSADNVGSLPLTTAGGHMTLIGITTPRGMLLWIGHGLVAVLKCGVSLGWMVAGCWWVLTLLVKSLCWVLKDKEYSGWFCGLRK
jgi:hypothetical protein